MEEAHIDWELSHENDDYEAKGLMYCYCLQEFNNDYSSFYNLEFSDGQKHCQTWFGLYSAAQALIYGVPLMIGLVNAISKFVLQKLSYLQKTHSIGERQILAAKNMMWISFINVGVLVLLVNLKIEYDLPLPILQGRYSEFSVEWYRLVGSSLCVQMTLMILSTHLSNLFMEIFGCARRCWDRRCSCDARKTRKLTQIEYEQVNTGTQVEFDSRYSNIIVVTLIVMLYGSGMPILYLIAAAFFFATYWTDKYLILHWYAKPVITDDTLIRESLKYYGFAVILHLIGGVLMYSNANILPTISETQWQEQIEEYDSYYSFGNLQSRIMIGYVCFFAVTLVIYTAYVIVYDVVLQIVKKLCCTCTRKVGPEQAGSDKQDFYRCTRYSTLRRLGEDLSEELIKIDALSVKAEAKYVAYKSQV